MRAFIHRKKFTTTLCVLHLGYMKYVLASCFFAFFAPMFLHAQTEVYVYPFATDNHTYQSGDTIRGEFTIHNVSTERQSDVYYEIGISKGANYKNPILITRKEFDPLYLEASSKRKIPFEYQIPAEVVDSAQMIINVYSAEKTLLAYANAPILIKANETPSKKIAIPQNIYLLDSVLGIVEFTGENKVYPEDSQKIGIEFGVHDQSHEVQSKITMTHVGTGEVQSSEPVSFVLDSEQETSVEIDIPQLATSGTYEGIVSFESESVTIPPFYFRYIVVGPSVVVTQVDSSILSPKKGQRFDVSLSYMFPNYFSEEERTAIFDPLIDATVDLEIKNELGQIIYTEQQKLSLETLTMNFNVRASEKTVNQEINVYIKDKEGNMLTQYKTQLPSEEALNMLYGISTDNPWVFVLGGLIVLLIISVIYKISHRQKEEISLLAVLAWMIIPVGFIFYTAPITHAYTFESGTLYGGGIGGASGFLVNGFYSPLPPEVRSYDPDELFGVKLSVKPRGYVSGSIRGYVQSDSNWSTFPPPQDLFEGVTSAAGMLSYSLNVCGSPLSNLHQWFHCNADQLFGSSGSSESVRLLGSYTNRVAGDTFEFNSEIDWVSEGIIVNNSYMSTSDSFLEDFRELLDTIGISRITQKSHTGTYVQETSSPYLPAGEMFMIFSIKIGHGWQDGYIPDIDYRNIWFLNFKYHYPDQVYRPSATMATRKNDYGQALDIIRKSKEMIVQYNLPGADIVSAFNFEDIDAQYLTDFNSPELNAALDPILDFLKNASERIHAQTLTVSQIKNANTYSQTYGAVSRSYFLETWENFRAPLTPGFYKIYTYSIVQQNTPPEINGPDNMNIQALVSQEICVRGAGLCPNEEPIICSNLTVTGGPVYTEDVGGIIYSNGVATDLVKDLQGNCVPPEPPGACFPLVEPVNYGVTCGCGGVGTIQCDGTCGDQYGAPVEITCPPEPLLAQCYPSPSPAVLQAGYQTVTFDVLASGGTLPYIYQWWSDSDATVSVGECTTSSCEQTYDSEGMKELYLTLSDSAENENSQSTQVSCQVWVAEESSVSSQICIDNIRYIEINVNGVTMTEVDTSDTSLCATNPPPNEPTVNLEIIPQIVPDSSAMCGMNAYTTGVVDSCRVYGKNNQILYDLTTTLMTSFYDGSIDTTLIQMEVPIGSYKIGCSATDSEGAPISILSEMKSCIVNPSVRES